MKLRRGEKLSIVVRERKKSEAASRTRPIFDSEIARVRFLDFSAGRVALDNERCPFEIISFVS